MKRLTTALFALAFASAAYGDLQTPAQAQTRALKATANVENKNKKAQDNTVKKFISRDAASGLPAGKRNHKPFVITKESVAGGTNWEKGGGASVGKPRPGKMNWEDSFDKTSTTLRATPSEPCLPPCKSRSQILQPNLMEGGGAPAGHGPVGVKNTGGGMQIRGTTSAGPSLR